MSSFLLFSICAICYTLSLRLQQLDDLLAQDHRDGQQDQHDDPRECFDRVAFVVNDYADGDEHEKHVAETKNAFQADQVEEGEDDGLLHCGSGALKGCFKQR